MFEVELEQKRIGKTSIFLLLRMDPETCKFFVDLFQFDSAMCGVCMYLRALLALGTAASQGQASSPRNGVPRIFTYADRYNPALCHLARSVEVSGGILHVLGLREGQKEIRFFQEVESRMSEDVNGFHMPDRFTGLKKHFFLNRAIRALPANDTIIFVDAFDVLFQGPFKDLVLQYHELARAHVQKHGHWPVIFGGELNCWPFPHHARIRVSPRDGGNRSWVHRIPERAALSDGIYHQWWSYPGPKGDIAGAYVCQEWLAQHSAASEAPTKRPLIGSLTWRKKLKRSHFPFLNTGAFVGRVNSLRRLLREIFRLFGKTTETCDQALLPLVLLRFPHLGFVDKDAKMFLNLHGIDKFHLERRLCGGNYFEAPRNFSNSSRWKSSKLNFQHFLAPRLRGAGDLPKILHFNGNGKAHLSRCVDEFFQVGLLRTQMKCRYFDMDSKILAVKD